MLVLLLLAVPFLLVPSPSAFFNSSFLLHLSFFFSFLLFFNIKNRSRYLLRFYLQRPALSIICSISLCCRFSSEFSSFSSSSIDDLLLSASANITLFSVTQALLLCSCASQLHKLLRLWRDFSVRCASSKSQLSCFFLSG